MREHEGGDTPSSLPRPVLLALCRSRRTSEVLRASEEKSAARGRQEMQQQQQQQVNVQQVGETEEVGILSNILNGGVGVYTAGRMHTDWRQVELACPLSWVCLKKEEKKEKRSAYREQNKLKLWPGLAGRSAGVVLCSNNEERQGSK